MASKKQTELENTVDSVMDKFFSNGDQKQQEEPEATEKPKAKRTTNKQTKAAAKVTEKPEKGKQKVFSFWADVETQKEWRAYAEVKRLSVSDLGRKAIAEYISRHKLTEDEKNLYDWLIGKK